MLNCDVIELTSDVTAMVSNLVPLITSVDWTDEEFDRNEITLKEGRLCLLPFPISKPEQLTSSPQRDILVSSLGPLINQISSLFPKDKIVRGELVNLLPGKSLTPHVDVYWFHRESKRIHIPMLTNPLCKLSFEDRDYHLEPGKLYEINNRIMHSGYNKGNTPRIHLILDFMPEEIFNLAVRSKQNFLEVCT